MDLACSLLPIKRIVSIQTGKLSLTGSVGGLVILYHSKKNTGKIFFLLGYIGYIGYIGFFAYFFLAIYRDEKIFRRL